MPQPKPEPDDALPPELAEPTDPAERERLLLEAEAEIEAGHATPNDDVLTWLRELAAGHHMPPPCDR